MSRGPRTGSVAIDNATGYSSFDINGVYEPTLELCGGLPVYQKKGEVDIWLQYFKSTWRICHSSWRDTSRVASGYAYNTSSRRFCLPHDCDKGAWFVAMDFDVFETAPLITVTLLSAPTSDVEAIVEQAKKAYDTEVNLTVVNII